MLEDLLLYIGIEDIRPLGDEIQGRCPAHEKRTGERENKPVHWSISRRTGLHYCFSCEYKGSLTRLVGDMTGLGAWDVSKLLIQHDVQLDKDEEEEWEPPPLNFVDQLERFGPPPRAALEHRRLKASSVQRFGLRFDREDYAWVLPIYSPAGALWGYQRKGTGWVRNFPPGVKKSRTLFGLSVVSGEPDTSSLVLVESPLDCVYLDGLGLAAVASYGAAVSDQQLRLLVERANRVILALDNDKAGITATQKILREHWHHRLPMTVFDYSHTQGKDPGECSPDEVYDGVRTASLGVFW
jgi:DNA primase